MAINGVPLYGNADAANRDAYVFEGPTFDQCRGHASPSASGDSRKGIYHYHTNPAPGCVYTDVSGLHSPLFGIMFDGVPIYGKYGDNGILPTNLDECNGHVDTTCPFYHYHVTSNLTYPYLTNCLKGCLNGTTAISDQFVPMTMDKNGNMIRDISQNPMPPPPQKPNILACNPQSKQYDYSPLKTQVLADQYGTPCSFGSTLSLAFFALFMILINF